MSINNAGVQADRYSDVPVLSADGRFVAFHSAATNLVPRDTNGVPDIFVHDRENGTVTRVSLSSSGGEANNSSEYPDVSADGSLVAFDSAASNLVEGDTNRARDIFARDRRTATTTRVSLGAGGLEANGPSYWPSLSADGRFVAFQSPASNLVPGDTNGANDIFVHDRESRFTTRASVSTDGVEANGESLYPHISANGQFVAFLSYASNLVAMDTNGVPDVFVHDRQTGATTRVSVHSRGMQANAQSFRPSMSGDGRFIAFSSAASNLVDGDTNRLIDVFLRDHQAGVTTRISQGPASTEANSSSWDARMSANGRYVAFRSSASNLVDGDTNGSPDVFLYDRLSGAVRLLSVAATGGQANGESARPAPSADGRFIAFTSLATNLSSDDTNRTADVFIIATPVN